MKKLALGIAALVAVAAVGALLLHEPTPAEDSAGVVASGEADGGGDYAGDVEEGEGRGGAGGEGMSDAPTPERGGAGGDGMSDAPADTNAESTTNTTSTPDEPTKAERREATKAFAGRVRSLLEQGDKAAYRELLGLWRSGQLPREQELALDEAISTLEGKQLDELTTAAGKLLLEVPENPERRLSLARLLASSGSQPAARFLIDAAAKPDLQTPALHALGSIADPEVLPVYRQQIRDGASPEVLDAIAKSLRQMETPKARELEQQLKTNGE